MKTPRQITVRQLLRLAKLLNCQKIKEGSGQPYNALARVAGILTRRPFRPWGRWGSHVALPEFGGTHILAHVKTVRGVCEFAVCAR